MRMAKMNMADGKTRFIPPDKAIITVVAGQIDLTIIGASPSTYELNMTKEQAVDEINSAYTFSSTLKFDYEI